jgi:diguanylate cyclase (GGDEF)-like protein
MLDDELLVDSYSDAPTWSELSTPGLGFAVPDNEAARVASVRLLKLLGFEDHPWWYVVTRLAAQICGTSFAAVNLIESTYQYSLASFGYIAEPIDRADSMCSTSIMSAFPSVTTEAQLDPRWADNPFVNGEIDQVRTYAAAPLTLATGHAIGVICAFSRDVVELTNDQVNALADLAALTVQMLDIRERSLQSSLAATRDPLTALPNRALMNETLTQNLLRQARGDANVAVVCIDLIGFKLINDEFGHATGDDLLRAVAQRLVVRVRASDLVSRVSSDEFVIVCTSIPDDAVRWTIDRVIEEVRMAFATPFILSNGPVRVAAAVGVAYAEGATDTATAILNRADTAMHIDKAELTQ